jgi:hypothetical protein
MKAERRRKLRERKRRGNRGLPRWCIYVAYFFSFVNCMFCSFCIMYASLIPDPGRSMVVSPWLHMGLPCRVRVWRKKKLTAIPIPFCRIRDRVVQVHRLVGS